MSAVPGALAGNVLGFDFGLRCIGIAVGTRMTGSARPLATLTARHGEFNWNELDRHVSEWSPRELIVGLPLSHEGDEQPITAAARAFANRLQARYGLETHLCDERHSSQEAARRFAAQRASGQRRRRDNTQLDAVAAAVILESWLSEFPCIPTCDT